MRSDDHNRSGKETAWTNPGIGMCSEFRCPRCGQNRTTLGRRLWKKALKLMQCAVCVGTAAKAAEVGAQ